MIQQVQITITAHINNPVNPIALTAKSSPINGRKSSIAPAYQKTINPRIIEIAFRSKPLFIVVALPTIPILLQSSYHILGLSTTRIMDGCSGVDSFILKLQRRAGKIPVQEKG